MSPSGNPSAPNTPAHGAGTAVMTEARRLLMRVSTQIHSHALDLARLEPHAASASSSVDLTELSRSGAREAEASPGIPPVYVSALPGVSETGDEAGQSILAFHTVVSADQAGFTEKFPVFVRDAPMAVAVPPLMHPVIEATAVASHAMEIRLAGGAIRSEMMIHRRETTSVMNLPVRAPTFTRPAKTAARSASVRFASPAVRAVPNRIVAEVALERRSTALPSMETPSGRAAHLMTRQLLARAAGAGVGEDDIVLVGIYRRVPLGAAAMLAIDDRTNALRLYLRPDAARMVQSGQRQLVSLVFGRVRSDGRLVRAMVQTPNPAPR